MAVKNPGGSRSHGNFATRRLTDGSKGDGRDYDFSYLWNLNKSITRSENVNMSESTLEIRTVIMWKIRFIWFIW